MQHHNRHLASAIFRNRLAVLVVGHLLLFSAAYYVAFLLRFDFSISPPFTSLFWRTLPWLLAVKMGVLWWFGNIHGWWRYVTFADFAVLLRVTTLSTLVVAAIDYFLVAQYQISRAVLVLDWGATLILLGGLRSTWRLWSEEVASAFRKRRGVPALVIADSQDCEALAHQLHASTKSSSRVVGFLHPNQALHGSRLGGIPFVGFPADAVRIAVERDVNEILVMAGSIGGQQLRRLVNDCRELKIRIHMIPPLDEIIKGTYRWQVRDVDIRDLLQRKPVELDIAPLRGMLRGRRVLVTGAGGSIGSEICRQVAAFDPELLILVERAENSLFMIEQSLRGENVQLLPIAADVGDEQRMREVFRQTKPDILFHAAAHKHVPLVEQNAGAALSNNVLGTRTLVHLADEFRVERFVLISTDKAVNPTSVMGVTKLLAERYVRAFADLSDTKFVVVRFGNVLASSGSVVPLFQEQIRNGGPVTVTHPEMKRFFMTIPEASRLVLHAAAMGRGGEVFILNMGQQIKVVDIARDLIRLSGAEASDIQVEYTGVRPGEKLFEELHAGDEQLVETANPALRIARGPARSISEIRELLDQVVLLIYESNETVQRRLKQLVPEYAASCEANEVVLVHSAADRPEETEVVAAWAPDVSAPRDAVVAQPA